MTNRCKDFYSIELLAAQDVDPTWQNTLSIAEGRRVAAMRRAIKQGNIDTKDNLDAAAERMIELNDREDARIMDGWRELAAIDPTDRKLGNAHAAAWNDDRTEDAMTDIPLVQKDQQGRDNVYPEDPIGAFKGLRFVLIVYMVLAGLGGAWLLYRGPLVGVTP